MVSAFQSLARATAFACERQQPLPALAVAVDDHGLRMAAARRGAADAGAEHPADDGRLVLHDLQLGRPGRSGSRRCAPARTTPAMSRRTLRARLRR